MLLIEKGINPSDKVELEIKYITGEKLKLFVELIQKWVEYYKNGGILQYVLKYDLIMDEDIAAIDANTRNQKIKDFCKI